MTLLEWLRDEPNDQASWSDFLGRGDRRFLNPFLGMRVGYGWLGGDSKLVLASDVGIEVYKQKYLLVDLSFRVVSFIDGDGATWRFRAGSGSTCRSDEGSPRTSSSGRRASRPRALIARPRTGPCTRTRTRPSRQDPPGPR